MTTTPDTQPALEPVTGNEAFVEVYALATGRKQTVPRHFLDDPVLGAAIRKTPSQRELDGELPARPTQDSTVKDIDRYAREAGIDLDSGADKDAKLSAVEAVFAHSDVQAGLADVEPDPVPADPLAPALVAQVPADTPTPISGGTEPTDQHPAAAGNEEN